MRAAPRSGWLVPAGLIALGVVPALAGAARVLELVRGAVVTAANARFFDMPEPVVLHITAVIPFSVLGALQVSPALRARHPRWHRGAGQGVLACGFIAALTGLWMTLTYPWPRGDGVVLYVERLVVGIAMLGCLLLATGAIRRRAFAVHGEWMIRAYAIGMGAGTQVLTHLPYFVLVGRPDETGRAVLMGAGWAINVVVAEWIIRRGSLSRSPIPRAAC
ncbi:MAG: DUF2306 domain-containing protein [Gemmatimonadaceae bacterium]|nr:DUF2306 domain-containing protein [Gemmatimonadaceae bacterium]